MSDTNALLNAASFVVNDVVPALFSPRLIGTACFISSTVLKNVINVNEADRRDPFVNAITTINNIAMASSAIAVCTGSTLAAATSFAAMEVNCLVIFAATLNQQDRVRA